MVSCAIVAPKQRLGARCGRKGIVDAQKEFSAAPALEALPLRSLETGVRESEAMSERRPRSVRSALRRLADMGR